MPATIGKSIGICMTPAAEAALLARSLGHAVTLFVNGWQVHCGAHYPLLRLNALLDQLQDGVLLFGRARLDMTTRTARKAARKLVKDDLCRCNSHERMSQLVDSLAHENGIFSFRVPEFLRTLTLVELRDLQAQGVRIENHGWTHRFLPSVPPHEIDEDISKGRAWIREHLAVDAAYYAVPFGRTIPPNATTPGLFQVWFLLDDALSAGHLGPALYNRSVLKF